MVTHLGILAGMSEKLNKGDWVVLRHHVSRKDRARYSNCSGKWRFKLEEKLKTRRITGHREKPHRLKECGYYDVMYTPTGDVAKLEPGTYGTVMDTSSRQWVQLVMGPGPCLWVDRRCVKLVSSL